MGPNKKMQISQDAFDAVVRENMEEFGMDLDEALQDAVTTYQMQGADLRGIITDGSGHGSSAIHPVVEAVTDLQKAAEVCGTNSGEEAHVEALVKALERLFSLCKDGGHETITIAGRHAAVEASISAFKYFAKEESDRVLAMKTLSLLLKDAENRDRFRRSGGSEMLMKVVTDPHEGREMKSHACNTMADSAIEDELVKERLMELNAADALTKLLKESSSHEDLILAVCLVVRSIVTADDNRVVASKAFNNARAFAEIGLVEAMLSIFSMQTCSSSTIAAICVSLKSLAVNEAICKLIAEQQGIDLILQALDESLNNMNNPLAKSALSLLSQLAGSDENKEAIVCKGGLERIIFAMSVYSNDPSILQEAMVVMAVLSLRMPVNATQAVRAGALDLVIEAMESHPSALPLQRSACQLLRNFAVRSPEIRSAILEKGMDRLIRQAKASHAGCKDAASAALRDLGFNDYKV